MDKAYKLIKSNCFNLLLFYRSAGCIFAEMIQNRILFSKNNAILKFDGITNENEQQFRLIVTVSDCKFCKR